MIYLDNAATTPMLESVADVYKKYACQAFYNPSAGYGQAIEIKRNLTEVRKSILEKLNARHGEIIFTSGATESNNLAIMGSKRNGKYEYIFSAGSHPSVYNVAKELEQSGHTVKFVHLQKNGQIDYAELESLLNEKTRLISIEHVNNETGAVNNIELINKLRKNNAPNALLHIDGVQAFCKINVNLEKVGVDLYSISAHKIYGAKGVGALYVKEPQKLKPIIFGGGQENNYRSGTENVPGIMALGEAVNIIDIDKNYKQVEKLKDIMLSILLNDKNVKYNNVDGSPYILSFAFKDVNGETLMRKLADEGVIVGTGSACSTKKAGNRVLQEMGATIDEIKQHIRISFNPYQQEDEIKRAAQVILKTYNEIREKVL